MKFSSLLSKLGALMCRKLTIPWNANFPNNSWSTGLEWTHAYANRAPFFCVCVFHLEFQHFPNKLWQIMLTSARGSRIYSVNSSFFFLLFFRSLNIWLLTFCYYLLNSARTNWIHLIRKSSGCLNTGHIKSERKKNTKHDESVCWKHTMRFICISLSLILSLIL